MTFEQQKTEPKWQNDGRNTAHQWEFYKTPQGLWNWRLVSPEGWDHSKGEWKQNAAWNNKTWEAAQSNDSNWNSLKGNIEWIELDRSKEGFSSKAECQVSAKKNGWTA